MRTVRKVTVSLPDQLVAQIEQLRKRTAHTRSWVITDLLWRGWQDVEQEEREARYRAAYAATSTEHDDTAWMDPASADFFEDADAWEGPSSSDPDHAAR
jgi:metal-responsive CopG/Arc/MetJ family transcriptional regulator